MSLPGRAAARIFLPRRERATVEIALGFVAALLAQVIQLFGRLDPLGDGLHAQFFRHADDGRNDSLVFLVAGDIPHKRLVYLELINRQPF